LILTLEEDQLDILVDHAFHQAKRLVDWAETNAAV